MRHFRTQKGTFPTFVNDLLKGLDDDFTTQRVWSKNQPAVNTRETETGFELELAAPGLGKDDFNIELDHNILTVSVSKEAENKEDKDGYTRREFNFNSFKSSFTLPDSIDAEKIEGNYENGVLIVALPKKEAEVAKKRSITIS